MVDIFLVKFELDSNGAYIDGMSDLIESVSVPSDIFNSLIFNNEGVTLSKLEVFKDESRSASFEIKCYLPGDILKLRERLRLLFSCTLRESLARVESASADELENHVMDSILKQFKVITSLDELFTLKLKRFLDDDSMVVRVNTNE